MFCLQNISQNTGTMPALPLGKAEKASFSVPRPPEKRQEALSVSSQVWGTEPPWWFLFAGAAWVGLCSGMEDTILQETPASPQTSPFSASLCRSSSSFHRGGLPECRRGRTPPAAREQLDESSQTWCFEEEEEEESKRSREA